MTLNFYYINSGQILFLFGIINFAYAASSGSEKDAPIVKQELDIAPDGTWHSSVETGNGIVIEEQGTVKNAGQKDAIEERTGRASWTAPDGQKIELTWTANEAGFQPAGAHLPVAPPIPPLIQRALEWIAAHPQKDVRP